MMKSITETIELCLLQLVRPDKAVKSERYLNCDFRAVYVLVLVDIALYTLMSIIDSGSYEWYELLYEISFRIASCVALIFWEKYYLKARVFVTGKLLKLFARREYDGLDRLLIPFVCNMYLWAIICRVSILAIGEPAVWQFMQYAQIFIPYLYLAYALYAVLGVKPLQALGIVLVSYVILRLIPNFIVEKILYTIERIFYAIDMAVPVVVVLAYELWRIRATWLGF